MAPVLPANAADPHTPTTMAAVEAANSTRRPFAVMRLASSGVTTNATMTRHTFASHDGSEEMFVPFIPGNKSSVFQEQYTQAHMRPNEQYRMYFATVPLRPAAKSARVMSAFRANSKRFRSAMHYSRHGKGPLRNKESEAGLPKRYATGLIGLKPFKTGIIGF